MFLACDIEKVVGIVSVNCRFSGRTKEKGFSPVDDQSQPCKKYIRPHLSWFWCLSCQARRLRLRDPHTTWLLSELVTESNIIEWKGIFVVNSTTICRSRRSYYRCNEIIVLCFEIDTGFLSVCSLLSNLSFHKTYFPLWLFYCQCTVEWRAINIVPGLPRCQATGVVCYDWRFSLSKYWELFLHW